jgi:RAB6A-GEF complex partner protein 1
LYEQKDSQKPGFRRESAELYIKDSVPPLKLEQTLTIPIDTGATCLVCIRDELMICTKYGHVLRYFWNGTPNRDYSLDLRRIPFCVDQLSARAVPITEPDTYIVQIDYSPLLGGFAAVFNDGRGAFLTASTLKFDPNQVQGIWAPLDDATCTAINHRYIEISFQVKIPLTFFSCRYRLIAFGRKNSHADVFSIDETSGGLILSHRLQLSSRDFPGCPGPVQILR